MEEDDEGGIDTSAGVELDEFLSISSNATASRLYAMTLAARVYEAQCRSDHTGKRILNPEALAANFIALALDGKVSEQ